MNDATKRNGAGWLGFIGVGIGLVVALIVDRLLADALVDRMLVAAGVTGSVAIVWLMVIRLVFGPTPARARVPRQGQP
jgi:hypothetical protein